MSFAISESESFSTDLEVIQDLFNLSVAGILALSRGVEREQLTRVNKRHPVNDHGCLENRPEGSRWLSSRGTYRIRGCGLCCFLGRAVHGR